MEHEIHPVTILKLQVLNHEKTISLPFLRHLNIVNTINIETLEAEMQSKKILLWVNIAYLLLTIVLCFIKTYARKIIYPIDLNRTRI